MYDSNMVKAMEKELIDAGVKELKTSKEVDSFFKDSTGTALLFVNSVCGCAAGSARPGLINSLQNKMKPNRVATVFAGVDKDATNKAREYFIGYAPSSPSMAVFRDGQLTRMIERHDIEGTPPAILANWLEKIYNKYCGKEIDEAIDISDPKSELEISVKKVKKMLDDKESFEFLDIRDENERKQACITGTKLLDQNFANKIISEWDKNQAIVIHCHHGMRSVEAVNFFIQQGFKNVKSMSGGISAWSNAIDTSVPQY